MLRRPAVIGVPARRAGTAAGSVACLAFVAVLGAAFWAGALWIAESILRIVMLG